MSKLHTKSSISKQEISSLFLFCESFLPFWIGSSRPKSMRIHADPDPQNWFEISRVILELLQTCNLAFKHLYERFRVGGLKGIFLIHTRTYCMYLHRWSYDVTFDPQELETKVRRSCRLSHPQLIHPCYLDTQYTVHTHKTYVYRMFFVLKRPLK